MSFNVSRGPVTAACVRMLSCGQWYFTKQGRHGQFLNVIDVGVRSAGAIALFCAMHSRPLHKFTCSPFL